MDRDGSIITAIRQKDMGAIKSLFFKSDLSSIESSYKTETELWDYKLKCPSINSPSLEWAEISKDILAFHNTGKGGVIFSVLMIKNMKLLVFRLENLLIVKYLMTRYENI